MEQVQEAQQATTTETAKTTEVTRKERDPKNGIYAIVQERTAGSRAQLVFARTRTELAKTLQREASGREVLGIIRGKELNMKERRIYSFN